MKYVVLAAFTLGLWMSSPVSAVADTPCPAKQATPAIALQHLRSAIERGAEAVVVALGSSSTQGAMATDLAHSYPALLQELLSAGLPRAHVAVLNRGIGGQDAAEELARLDVDVIAVRP